MNEPRLRGLLRAAAVVLAVLLASAIAAPVIHAFLPYPFPRVFNRVVMVTAIIALAIAVRARGFTPARVGMAWTPDSARFLRVGFLTGVAGIAAFVLISAAAGHAGVAIKQAPAIRWAVRIAEGLMTGALVGAAEEFLFRGFVFTSVRDFFTRGRVWPAMVATSVLYALTHIAHVQPPAVGSDPGFADSLRLMLAALQALADWRAAWPAAVGLFLFGMVLNACAVRFGSLYPSIGLHAGAVTVLRSVGLFVSVPQERVLLWGSARVYDGVLGWAGLLLMGAVLVRRLRRGERRS